MNRQNVTQKSVFLIFDNLHSDENHQHRSSAKTERIYITLASLNERSDTVTFNHSFFYEYGRCYTFKPKVGVRPPPGSHYGYRFLFYKYDHRKQTRSSSKKVNYAGGWELFVHDAEEYWSENEPLSDSQQEHFFIDIGYKVRRWIAGLSPVGTQDSSGMLR